MTSCRADSFYVAPGEYRSFDEWALFTQVDGQWVRATHRRDIERFSATGNWDGVCYVLWRTPGDRDDSSPLRIESVLAKEPDRIELWRLDDRLVNGKRSGPEYLLHAVAKYGTARAGGVRDTVGGLLGVSPASKAVVRWFSEQPPHPTAQASALKLLHAANKVLDDSAMQSLVASMRAAGAVPMPVFDTALVSDLRFLERYTMPVRTKLLASLWQKRLDTVLVETLRVAGDLTERAEPARSKAFALIRTLSTEFEASVAQAIVDDRLWFEGVSAALTPGVVRALLTRPRQQHRVAFHPTNQDPTAALAILRDSEYLEQRSLVLFDDAPLHPSLVKAIREELESGRYLHHTHSANKCRNLLQLTYALCEVDPSAGPLLAQAYASWTRTQSALLHWHTSDIDALFASRGVVLDQRTIGLLYKRHVEHARFAGSRETMPERDWLSVPLLAMLEAQPAAAPRIREAATRVLAEQQVVHRGAHGQLASWSRLLQQGPITVERFGAMARAELSACVDTIPQQVVHSGELLAPMLHKALCRNPDPATTEQLIECALALGTEETASSGFATVPMMERECLQLSERARRIARAVRGDLTTVEIAEITTGDPLFYKILTDAVTLPRELRDLLFKTMKDPDYVYISLVLDGEAAPVSSGLDDISAGVQLGQILAEHPDVTWPEKPRTWADIPGLDHLPWDMPGFASRIDGTQIRMGEGLFDLRVISNIEDLRTNAAPNCMGNCTAEHYASSSRRGSTVVLALGRGGRTEINVSLAPDRQSGLWRVTEAKGRHNRVLPRAHEEELVKHVEALVNAAS
jgi:hypothetical protein